jgi:hypothetical protein
MTGFSIPGAIEAEGLVSSAKASAGGFWAQDMGQWEYGEAWSNRGALFWQAGSAGPELILQVPCPADGTYTVVARMVSGPGFGTVRFALGGRPAGEPADLYASQVTPREVALGTFDLKAGPVPLSITSTGINPQSKGFDVGIDALLLSKTP